MDHFYLWNQVAPIAPAASVDDSPPFRFFDLPRELRDRVYHHLWTETPVLEPYPARNSRTVQYIRAEYRARTISWDQSESGRLPYWILVNSRFFEEAMDLFYRNVDWMAQIAGNPNTTDFYIGSHEPPGMLYLEIVARFLQSMNCPVKPGNTSGTSHSVVLINPMDDAATNMSNLNKMECS